MAKTSKGQEFLESYKDKDHQKIYDVVSQNKDQTANEIAKKLLKDNDIKLSWQNADSETEKT